MDGSRSGMVILLLPASCAIIHGVMLDGSRE